MLLLPHFFPLTINPNNSASFTIKSNLTDAKVNPQQHPYYISISAQDKGQIYKLRHSIIIIKLLGWKVAYNFLKNKLTLLWQLFEDISLIELGEELYLIKWNHLENYSKVMTQGPWFVFVHSQYLTIQNWEPKLNPTVTHVN